MSEVFGSITQCPSGFCAAVRPDGLAVEVLAGVGDGVWPMGVAVGVGVGVGVGDGV
jgi:hypothetical protein